MNVFLEDTNQIEGVSIMRTGFRIITVFKLVGIVFIALLTLSACGGATSPQDSPPADATAATPASETAPVETLPPLEPVELAPGEKLRVVATTNIIADVVANVGGDHIDLAALLSVGADPHSFEATPSDYRALEGAHALFINGLHLEEALAPVLDTVRDETPVVSVNAGVKPLTLADEADHAQEAEEHEHEEHEHGGVDPHTWMDVRNVKQWVANIQEALSELDPANADAYAENADRYLAELDALAAELADKVAELPADQRKLVTDHDSFGYFAAAYDFTIVGTVIPSFSTLASPSAQDLARLHDQIKAEGVKAVFVGMTVNPKLADQLASDLGIQVVSLYTGSLSDKDGPAATYIDYMRYNVNAIVDALK